MFRILTRRGLSTHRKGLVRPLPKLKDIRYPGLSLHRTTSFHTSRRWLSTEKEPEKPSAPKENEKSSQMMFDPKAHLDKQLRSPIVSRMEQRIKRVVDDLNPGDQLSAIVIAILLVGILAAPYTIPKMKQSDSTYEDLATEDPIDDFAKLARQEWGVAEEGKSAVEVMLRDLMQSKALQDASRDFVVQLLDSSEVKQGLNRLVKELWSDLVSDPDTVKQVVHLLNIAIQDPKVKEAAQKLVVELVDQPEVKNSLILLIEKLGKDEEVLAATQVLLTNSAHRSLNDPEILEHTMEFASDIVGDDIVQQSARDALWNTFGQALRPATTVLLTAAGVGLIIFGVVSIAYSRSSEQEVQLFDSALRSLSSNATHGIIRMISWPFRYLQSMCAKIEPTLLYPFTAIQEMSQSILQSISDFISGVIAAPGQIWESLWNSLVSTTQSLVLVTMQKLEETSNSFLSSLMDAYSALLSYILNTCAHFSKDLQRFAKVGKRDSVQAAERTWMKFLDVLLEIEQRITAYISNVFVI